MAQQGNRTVRASGSGPSPPHLPLSNKTKTTTPQPPQTSWETTTPAEVDRTNELEKKEEPPGGTPGEKGATRSSTGNAHRPPGQGARKSTAAPRPPPLSKEYFMSSFSKSRDSNRQSVPTVKSKDTSIQPSSHSPKSSSPISVPSGRKELYSPRSSPTSASTDDRRATYSFNTVRTDHVGGPETGKGHQQHRLAPKGNKSISDVSRDRYTKQKAVMSFVHDPAMEATIEKIHDGRRTSETGISNDVSERMESFRKTQDTLISVHGDKSIESVLHPRQRNQRSMTMIPSRSFSRGFRDSTHFSVTSAKKLPKQSASPQKAMPRSDTSDIKIQQLRGIFAGFDENRDNVLEIDEINNALLSLGIKPTEELVARFFKNSSSNLCVDLATFIRTCLEDLDGAETTLEEVTQSFSPFDTNNSGIVDISILRHLLTSVHTGSELTSGEADDLLQMIGVNSGSNQRDKLKLEHAAVNYRDLVDAMMFSPSYNS